MVSVCRTQPLCVEGIDPAGVYRVQIDDEPARDLAPRSVHSIQTLLSEQAESTVAPGLRASTPGLLRFIDLQIVGEQDRFVERTIRINRLTSMEADAAKAAIAAATPARTGRVT